MEQRFIFANSFSTPFIFGVGIFALAVALFSYLFTKRKLSLEWKLGLLGLRLIAILLMIITLMRPAIEKKEKFVEKAQLYFLLDQSESMSFKDDLERPNRATEVNRVFGNLKLLLNTIQKNYEVKIYDIRNGLLPNEKGFLIEPNAYSSPITQSLRSFLAEAVRKRSMGAILITDGQDTQLEDPASLGKMFAQKEIPVYTIGAGNPKEASGIVDIQAIDMKLPLNSFQENVFVVNGEFQLLGCKDKTVELEFLVNDKVISKKTYNPTQLTEKKFYKFLHSIKKKGLYKISLRATPIENELSHKNNKIESFIEIFDGDLKVLYLEGQARSEFKFLARAFQQAREIHIKSFLLFGRGSNKAQIPQKREDWMKYDVIIFGDLPKSRFTKAQLETLKETIEEGGRGFLMIGGFENFGNGDYQNSPIADLLPVELEKKQEQFFGFFQPSLTKEGEKHFVLRLHSDLPKSLSAWSSLPKLDGYTKVSKIKPTAEILLKAKKDPLLVYYPYGYGKGRSMAFLADTTWRWSLNKKTTSQYFKKFWRQMILWLAKRDSLNKDKVWIQLEDHRFPISKKIPIKVFAEKTSGETTSGKAELTLIDPAGKKSSFTSQENEKGFQFQFQPLKSGVYTLKAEVVQQKKLIGKDETKLVVYRPNLEMENPHPDFETLEMLSKTSNGAFYPLDRLKKLLEELEEKPSAIVIDKVVIKDVWDNWFFFLLFLIVLGAEWALRKFKGLA